MVSVVGCGLSLPFDVEPYGTGDSEYATAPFLNAAAALGLPVVARLKGNVPALFAAASTSWPRAAERSRTRVSTTPRTVTA